MAYIGLRYNHPIMCDWCLFLNKSRYVDMAIAPHDKECKMCSRMFPVSMWSPGRNALYKDSVICKSCGYLKKVCQFCLLDLEYGLPPRDAHGNRQYFVGNNRNKDYFVGDHDRKTGAMIEYESSLGKAFPNNIIEALFTTTLLYNRNHGHIHNPLYCYDCILDQEFPFRHDMPPEVDLSEPILEPDNKSVTGPMVMKILKSGNKKPCLWPPPEDESIRTLFVGGFRFYLREDDLREKFEAHGEVEAVVIVGREACAFVTYTTREDAEKAAKELGDKLVVKGSKLKMLWALASQTPQNLRLAVARNKLNHP